MAISLEELALGALEGSAGPLTLAVGAGALAVALAAGSARPLRRMAASGAVTVQRTGQLNVMSGIGGWIGGVRRSWRDLVAEARAEYEAGRRKAPARPGAEPPLVLKPEDRAEPSASGRRVFVVEPPASQKRASPEAAPPPDAGTPSPPGAARDRRGRFVRRRPSAIENNGTRAE
jgi:hypothetical protein